MNSKINLTLNDNEKSVLQDVYNKIKPLEAVYWKAFSSLMKPDMSAPLITGINTTTLSEIQSTWHAHQYVTVGLEHLGCEPQEEIKTNV